MQYIFQDENGAFDLTKYEDYLESEREALVGLIQGPDLLLIDRFIPTGPGSFHDSRFEQVTATTVMSERGGEARATQLELRLIGPYFDRHFTLRYDEVASCSLEMPGPDDDLLMHELRSEAGFLVHEMRFDKAKSIEVRCLRISFSEDLTTDKASREQ